MTKSRTQNYARLKLKTWNCRAINHDYKETKIIKNAWLDHEINRLKVRPLDCQGCRLVAGGNGDTFVNLTVQTADFWAKSRTTCDAEQATNYMTLKSIHPQSQTYKNHANGGLDRPEHRSMVVRVVDQSPLGGAANLAVRRSDFNGELCAPGEAKRAREDRRTSMTFPRT